METLESTTKNNGKMSDHSKKAYEVFVTYDYNLFNFYSSNRKPTHYKQIMASMGLRDLSNCLPILVNEDMIIIDGQNRFHACKESGRPIYYHIQPGLDEDAMIILNTNQVNWGPSQYLRYYCIKRNFDYLRLKDVHLATKLGISLLHTINISGVTPQKSSVMLFNKGELRFKEHDKQTVKSLYGYFSVLQAACSENLPSGLLMRQLLKISRNRKVNMSQFGDKIKKYGFMMKRQVDSKAYLVNLEDIYNHYSATKISFKY